MNLEEIFKRTVPERGPALIYVDDGDPPTVTRLDHADEDNFKWMDSRSLRIMQALIDEAQSRINVFREDIGK